MTNPTVKPGDRIRFSNGSIKGCEARVTYSLNRYGKPKVLITRDPARGNKESIVGITTSILGFDRYEVIEEQVNKESDLHEVDNSHILFNI